MREIEIKGVLNVGEEENSRKEEENDNISFVVGTYGGQASNLEVEERNKFKIFNVEVKM